MGGGDNVDDVVGRVFVNGKVVGRDTAGGKRGGVDGGGTKCEPGREGCWGNVKPAATPGEGWGTGGGERLEVVDIGASGFIGIDVVDRWGGGSSGGRCWRRCC